MDAVNKKFHLVACGGTFDLLHKGHKNFLHYIFKHSSKVVIGLTNDIFKSTKKPFESFSIRQKSLTKFLSDNNYNAEVIEISDIYGPTLEGNFKFGAIFVTDDSISGAEIINKRREDVGLKGLEIIRVDLEKTYDGKIISSNRIRSGEIDRDGNLYIDDNFLKYNHILPQNLRKELSEPFGELIEDFDKWADNQVFDPKNIVTVGDVITSKLLKKKITPKLSVIDLIVNRKSEFESIYELGFESKTKFLEVVNPAGQVSSSLMQEIKKIFESNFNTNLVIKIIGEDDLAVIPVVLAAPLGYEIYYGQPGRGVVRILVTEQTKQEVKDLILKFKRKVL